MSNQKNDSYVYEKDALIIKIKTACPAELHRWLAEGIIDSMRNYIKSDRNEDSPLPLLYLLKALQPDERQLQFLSENSSLHS